MGVNESCENLVFSGGEKIRVTRRVDVKRCGAVHWHPHMEVLVSRCDGNAVTVNFKRHALDRGDIAIVCGGDPHAVHCVREDAFLVIRFPLILLAIMGELRGLLPRLSRIGCVRLDPEDPVCADIPALVVAIEASCDSRDAFREVRIYTSLLELFARVGRLCLRSEDPQPAADAGTERANMRRMAEACLYIAENCVKPLKLGEVASHMGMSESHFAHLFKRCTGMTFVDYLTAERIALAESFFTNPRLHIIDIAFESGFSSISAFNRAFRKVKGCSPTQFRAMLSD